VSTALPDYVLKDLGLSGLVPEDVNARILDSAERAATMTPFSTPGYVLPYFEATGRIRPFYRVRLFESDVKYLQPRDSLNHIYFPKNFAKVLHRKSYVIITEGEKKAAAACKVGFPTVGLGGVESWRNRTLLIPKDAELNKSNTKLAIKMPAGLEVAEESETVLAVGLQELIDIVIQDQLTVVIIYDSDNTLHGLGTKPEVQRAAATLGYELRFRGVPFVRVRQLVLPAVSHASFRGDKVGLDDYILFEGPDKFGGLLQQTMSSRGAFPRHPNVRDYINRRLQRTKLSRKETQAVALAVLSDLDTRGLRLKAPTGDIYYFDHQSKVLLKVQWPSGGDPEYDNPFTQFMYREYGLSQADLRLITWLGTQFAAEQPIDNASPHRVLARPREDEDRVYLQLNDAQYITVDADGIKVFDNGEHSILFECDHTESLEAHKVSDAYHRLQQEPVANWWAATLAQVRLRDRDKQRVVAALLYYLSPWLFRWRGMQLPVELIVGEAGSGKSTLCELRLAILTGRPVLRNTPSDIKDWYASIVNSGGLHVTDNVQLANRELRQKLSDEVCRIVTEPDPFVEQRRYYTNADLVRFPVRVVFALTSIQQPFHNADLLQRAFILELDKSLAQNLQGVIRYDSKWKSKQVLGRGGRELWIAHHLVVLNRFFKLVRDKWNDDYHAKQRLINLEQAMVLMAEVFGTPSNWIPDFMVASSDRALSETDWILEGLIEFAHAHYAMHPDNKFLAATIANWCADQDEYKNNELLTNNRKLGRYLKSNKSAVFTLTGIREIGMEGNRAVYRFVGKPIRRRQEDYQ